MTLTEKFRLLRSRKIVAIVWNRFDTGRIGSGKWSTDPTFYLDDGTRITFSVQETEIGEYGISVNVHPKEGSRIHEGNHE